MFKRDFSDDLISLLNKPGNQLWTENFLLGDIKKGKVFPAIRNQRIDFYHQGGKLFTFDKNGFKTNIKYASVYSLEKDAGYISETELTRAKIISSFSEGYKRIQENCASYSGDEARGVSRIYSKYSYLIPKLSTVVLDIEVSLESMDEDRAQDRIDLLLYNKEANRLIFCEAKRFSNSEIWSEKIESLRVLRQVKRYERQIENKEEDIKNAYSKYIRIVRSLFGIVLPEPASICQRVPLIIFGFDSDQLEGKFKNLFKDRIDEQIKYYPIGNISGLQIGNIIKKCSL